MILNFLLLNPDKANIVCFAPEHLKNKLCSLSRPLDDTNVASISNVQKSLVILLIMICHFTPTLKMFSGLLGAKLIILYYLGVKKLLKKSSGDVKCSCQSFNELVGESISLRF